MKVWLIGISLLILSACAEEKDRSLIHINKESILHDNSSKIWVVSKVLDKDKNISQQKLHKTDVAIFFKSGKVYFQSMASLGYFPERRGKFILSKDSKTLNLDFEDEKWNFNIMEISAKKIKLKSKKRSDFKYDLELISYPEAKE